MILTVMEREAYLAELSEEQRHYLTEQLTRGRRTAFANAMAVAKGHHIPDDAEPEAIELLLDEWIYSGYTDAGVVSPELRCECGRPLRYQHRVTHKTSGEERRFGIEHLKEHLGIDASVVSAIKQGFDAIDYELDEMLIKLRSDWQPDAEWSLSEDLTEEMQAQLALGLPLLERQIRRLQDRRRRARAIAERQQRSVGQPARATASAASAAPVAASAAGAPAAAAKREAPVDLFDWLAQEEAEAAASVEPAAEPVEAAGVGALVQPASSAGMLSPALEAAVLAYVRDGARSARVICELLIRDKRAGDSRFSTGKPHLYVPVCLTIEAAFPHATVEPHGHEDRYYAL